MIDRFGRPLTIDGTFPTGRLACASVIDTALATTDAASFFAAFDANKFWGGPWTSHVEVMSHDTRMLRMTKWLLWTRKDPKSLARDELLAVYGTDFEGWLREIGATETSRYVQELMNLYPDGVPFAPEIDRDRHLTASERAKPGMWREIRARYPSLEDELAARLRVLLHERGAAIGEECDALRSRFAEPLPPTLGEVLAASSTDAEFSLAFLSWLDAPRGRPPLGFEGQPDVGRMLWVLDALSTSVSVSGMSHFLFSNGVGRYFPKLAAWAKRIGADITADYVKAATAELKRANGGKLPSMIDAKRIETMHELEQRDEAAGGRGLFLVLDEQYGVLVVAELNRRLRAYVQENAAAIEVEMLDAVNSARQ